MISSEAQRRHQRTSQKPKKKKMINYFQCLNNRKFHTETKRDQFSREKFKKGNKPRIEFALIRSPDRSRREWALEGNGNGFQFV